MFDGLALAKPRTQSVALGVVVAVLLIVGLAVPIQAQDYPEVIPLPDGWQPEGIAIGEGTTFYVGSLATGAIYRGDLLTGQGSVLVQPPEGRIAVGLAYDPVTRFLWVAGGPGGAGYVYDTVRGRTVRVYQFVDPATTSTFVNDVVVTDYGAFFTDSFRPVLYFVPFGGSNRLPDRFAFREIPLGGEFEFIEGAFNANGIEALPNGRTLIVINSTTGKLYRVNPFTGQVIEIEVTGGELTMGDGILLDGRTLYVVRNRANEIAVVQLNNVLTIGRVVGTITDDDFDVPTTIDQYGDALYAVNARFGTPPGPDVEYWVTRVMKP